MVVAWSGLLILISHRIDVSRGPANLVEMRRLNLLTWRAPRHLEGHRSSLARVNTAPPNITTHLLSTTIVQKADILLNGMFDLP